MSVLLMHLDSTSLLSLKELSVLNIKHMKVILQGENYLQLFLVY
jgi:hypothetical protein